MTITSLACGSNPPAPSKAHAGASATSRPAEDKVVAGQTLYVPVYSHVDTADGGHPFDLAATLFIRNTDRTHPIVLTRVESFDSSGKSLRTWLKTPIKLDPMASTDYFIQESDETGGPSPSFLVEWVATEVVSDPLVESVMIGTTGSQGVSFVCAARVLSSKKR